jgi:hypothetical protein
MNSDNIEALKALFGLKGYVCGLSQNLVILS